LGITTKSLLLLMRGLEMAELDLQGLRMLEFGNQHLYLDDPTIARWDSPAKPWFKARGVDHISIDLNGRDGALKMNLACLTLERHVRDDNDVVTNFGTLEHIGDAHAGLYNMRQLCRVGGIMIHNWPMAGHWPGHGDAYATEDLLRKLADLHGDELLHVGTDFAMGNQKTGWEVQAIIRRSVRSTLWAPALKRELPFPAE
jgi:hypothetical protein